MKKNLLLLGASLALALLGSEAVLRALNIPPRYEAARPAGDFWQASTALGWDGRRNFDAFYASGACLGHVTLDAHGNRLNADTATFRPDAPTVFFIGDSNTAALEVDNDETLPARLEQAWRAGSQPVNVLNLGVRGYGTDQAVRKALLHAPRYEPATIIYLFTDNDFFNNNVLRQPFQRYGKGAYRADDSLVFTPYQYPVSPYAPRHHEAIVLDEAGRPLLFNGTWEAHPPRWQNRLSKRLARHSYLYSAVIGERGPLAPILKEKGEFWHQQQADPFEVWQHEAYDDLDVYFALFYATGDGGVARQKHRAYYEAQFTHLIEQLWTIPSLRQLHLAVFPSHPTRPLLHAGKPSTNLELFTALRDRGLLSNLVVLDEAAREQGVMPFDFQCPRGDHYTAQGYAWMASVLLNEIALTK